MKQKFFLLIGAVSVVALSAAAACTVETVDGTTTGTGGSTSTMSGTMATTGNGGGMAGTGGAAGVTGSGGGKACFTCGEYLNEAEATVEDVCGYTEQGCEPDSSCAKLQAIGDCVCGPDLDGSGKCFDACPVSCDKDPMGDDGGCMTCALTECGAEAQACLNDI